MSDQPSLLAESYRDSGKRDRLDRYYTPPALAETLVRLLPIGEDDVVLEPSVGGGAFLRAVQGHRPRATLTAIDIDPNAAGLRLAERSWVGDFLREDAATHGVDWVIGNPPFGDALTHIERALDVARDVAFLLRLGILSSKARHPFWRTAPLRKVWVLSERPSFTGGGTDSYDYGFFWWDATWEKPAEIEVLSWR